MMIIHPSSIIDPFRARERERARERARARTRRSVTEELLFAVRRMVRVRRGTARRARVCGSTDRDMPARCSGVVGFGHVVLYT